MTNVCDANETRFARTGCRRWMVLKRKAARHGRRCRWEKQTARPHRADTCASRQVSALFGPHRWPDSSALQPLHSTSFQLHKLRFHSIAFRRSQTAETVNNSGAPGNSGSQRPRCSAYRPGSIMAARLRPAKALAIRREASPVAEDKAIARDASHGQDAAIVAVTASFRGTPLLAGAARTCACETGRHRWKNYLV